MSVHGESGFVSHVGSGVCGCSFTLPFSLYSDFRQDRDRDRKFAVAPISQTSLGYSFCFFAPKPAPYTPKGCGDAAGSAVKQNPFR